MAIKIRLLKSSDLKPESGFWKTLAHLAPGKKVSYRQAVQAYRRAKKQGSYIFVAIEPVTNQIVGTVTLLVEQKFIRNLALAGHIEDVVTRKGFEGQGVASQLIKAALKKAKVLGCYKVILDCRKELVSFYRRFGFKAAEVEMKIYFKK
ncbi:MAG: GNAT family N-acetyltransferase [Candidatus Buchananbacteria bacterium]|nr:GNAT family N-acetyltransferase [Candidatus Buchananbacteria bacterium]